MVSANFDHRFKLHPSCENMISPASFAREFKTIHLNVGRQTGKTSMMMELARPSDLIVTSTLSMLDHLYQIRGKCRAEIVTVSSLRYVRYRDLGNSWVWMDEPSFFNGSINEVYNRVQAGLYIKLGE